MNDPQYPPWMTRDEVKECVRTALLEVADFSGDFENFTLNHFQPFHVVVFLMEIKKCVMKSGFDVALNEGMMGSWLTIKEIIDYITQEQVRYEESRERIQLE